MSNKKKIALIAGAVVLVGIILVIVFTFMTNKYNDYATAYKNLFKSGSVECKFDAVMNIDNKDYKSTGDMKIKQNDQGQMKFMLTMESSDSKLTEFTDGEYIYNDVNGVKTKFKIGEKSTSVEADKGKDQKFDLDLYKQKLSSIIEAGKIKDLQLLEQVDSKYVKDINSKNTDNGKQYEIIFADGLKANLEKVFSDEQANGRDGNEGISVNDTDVTCTFDANDSKVLTGANYTMSFNVTLPAKLTGESANKVLPVKLTLNMTFVNPGSPVDLGNPSTDGYKE